MSLDGFYEEDNIFAQIIKGTSPCVKIFEDDVSLAFMDIFPESAGHSLIIPKTVKSRNLFDFPENLIGPYMKAVYGVAGAVKKALQPDGVTMVQYNGSSSGQTVFHLHFHVIPVYHGQALKRHHGVQESYENLERIARRIRQEI